MNKKEWAEFGVPKDKYDALSKFFYEELEKRVGFIKEKYRDRDAAAKLRAAITPMLNNLNYVGSLNNVLKSVMYNYNQEQEFARKAKAAQEAPSEDKSNETLPQV